MRVRLQLIFFFTLFLCLQNNIGFAQDCPDDLVPGYDAQKKQWGYKDLFGQWVIQPIFTKVSLFSEGKAVFQNGTLSGVIDCEGNVVLHAEYERLTNYRYGKIWAKKNGLWSLMDHKGKVLLPAEYSDINPIQKTELSWIKKGELWGLFNEEKGTFICKPQYKLAQVMSENATLVQVEKPLLGVVNHVNCNYLLPLNLTSVKKVAQHTIIFQQQNKWGVFDEYGKIIANAEYDSISLKHGNAILIVKQGNLYGLRTTGGHEVLPVKYQEIADYSDGFFKLKEKDKYGFANKYGKIYIKPEYEEASDFIKGQAVVKKNGYYGVIDYKNAWVLKPEYAEIQVSSNGDYAVISDKSGEKFYLTSYPVKKSIDTKVYFEKVLSMEDSVAFVRVKKDNKVQFYNTNTNTKAFEPVFEEAQAYQYDYSIISLNSKKGLIDYSGKLIVPAEYEKIEYVFFSNKLVFQTYKEGLKGIVDQQGKNLIQNEYQEIVPALPNYLKVKKSDKYGIIRTSGLLVSEPIFDHMTNSLNAPNTPDWPAVASKKDKWGLLTEKAEELVPLKYSSMKFIGENHYAGKLGKIFQIINNKGVVVVDLKYEEVGEIGNGLIAVKKGDKWGYVNLQGVEVIKPQYEEAYGFYDRMTVVKIKGKYGVIDMKGKELLAPDFEKIARKSLGEYILYKDGKEFFLSGASSLKVD